MSKQVRTIELREDTRGKLIGHLEPTGLLLTVRRNALETTIDLRATAAAGFTVVSSIRRIPPSELKAERGG